MAQSATPYQRTQSAATPTLHFCPLEAEALGLGEAIVVSRLRFWLSRSKHHFGGRPWVYNTYSQWQRQFPFWSVFTVKAIFRRLEHLGVLESTQRFNTNRWRRTKWYTLNLETLAELTGSGGKAAAAEPVMAEAAAGEAAAPLERPSSPPIEGTDQALIEGTDQPPIEGTDQALIEGIDQPPIEGTDQPPIEGIDQPPIEGTDQPPIEGTDQPPIEGIDVVPCLNSGRSTEKISKKRGCARELDGGARTHPLDPKAAEAVVNELDAAYEAIPEAERETWLERARRALAAAGMPEWMRIIAVVKEMAVRLWVGSTIPGMAPSEAPG